MAELFIGVILAIFFGAIFIRNYKANMDLFAPLCVFSLFQFLRYVPNLLIGKTYEHFTSITNDMVIKLLFVEIIFCCFVIIGYRSKVTFKTGFSINVFDEVSNQYRVALPFIFFLYLIGLSSRYIVIKSSGGIGAILNDVSGSYLRLSNGFGYITVLSNLIIISLLLLLEYISKESSSSRRSKLIIVLILMYLVAASSYLVFSSRTQPLVMLLTLLFGYNYFFKKIEFNSMLNPKAIVVIIVGVFIVLVFPQIRDHSYSTSDGFNNSMLSFFNEFSYLGRDCFVYNHFNFDNYWWGRSFLNILYAPIPSAFLKSKPAIDDGIYLIHLLNGIPIEPNAGRDSFFFKYSIPFSSQSSLFANFGWLGLILGGLFTGKVYNWIYKMVKSVKSGLVIVLYYVFVYLFAFTTYNIVHTIVLSVIVLFVNLASKAFYIRSNRDN